MSASAKTVRETQPALLYVHTPATGPIDGRLLKADMSGFNRYAAARGWAVRELVVDVRHYARSIRAALSGPGTVGCVVSAGGPLNPPPEIFGGVPAVYMEPSQRLCRLGVPRIVMDNSEIARFAFRELMARHPVALAFIGGRNDRIWSKERGRAFAALARAASMPFFPFRHRRETDSERDARLHAFVRALPGGAAVFCATDRTASDVSRFAVEEHRRVPQELAFIGVNDIRDERQEPLYPVTSVRLDVERRAYEAAKMVGDIADSGARGRPAWPPRPPGLRVSVGPLLVARRESTRGRGRRKPDIMKALETIRAEACKGLTAAALAARFPGSRRLFDMRFLEAMGHPANDEILHVRLEKVCALLSRKDVAIDAICFQCGFNSKIALQRLFARRYGISMREWRRRHSRQG